MKIEVRFATPEQKEEAENFSKKFKAIRDFRYTWNRWKNWQSGKPPIVAVDLDEGSKIVGLHAATFSTRTMYTNSFYQAVDPEYQGMRIGGSMVDYLISYGFSMCKEKTGKPMQRIKMKTPENSPGHRFWSGFGLKPFGIKGGVLLWDEDIRTVGSVTGLIEWMTMREYHLPIPTKVLQKHKDNGVKSI